MAEEKNVKKDRGRWFRVRSTCLATPDSLISVTVSSGIWMSTIISSRWRLVTNFSMVVLTAFS